jgi:hypothetical protein
MCQGAPLWYRGPRPQRPPRQTRPGSAHADISAPADQSAAALRHSPPLAHAWTHGYRSSASPAVCRNYRGFPSRLARTDPTRQHALAPSPASAVPRRRAKKWAVYQALGIGTLARVPCREPPPRVLPSSATGWAPEGRSPEAGTWRALPRDGHGERAMRTITSPEPPTEPRWMREGRLSHPWAADRGIRLRETAASVLKSRGGDQWSW